ncbi:unnamed protein product, partial [marine sediment metagenome]
GELPPWAKEIRDKPAEDFSPTDTEGKEKFQEPLGDIREQKVERPVEAAEKESVDEFEEKEIREPSVAEHDEKVEEDKLREPIEAVQEAEEESAEEKIPFAETTMGLPEGVDQKALPFSERPLLDRIEFEDEKERKVRTPSNFFDLLKSRAFDLFFIAALWIVTLWFASLVTEVSIFQLISASTLNVVGFYIILLAGYFFLFLFFLGETVGDNLFSREK